MKYDIFVSYSRKDFDEVKQLIDFIKQRIPTISYWFDLTGVESGDEFEDKIISAIENSAYVIFALSDNSIESNWTKDEVTYAKNTDKKVIPILLKGAKLKGWFLFKFGRIDCIDSTDRRQMDKFLENLSNWTSKALTNGEIESISTNHTPQPTPHPITAKTYKVGDYYDDGKKQGVVFEVSADGKHGKIVSLKEKGWCKWDADCNFGGWFQKEGFKTLLTGANHKRDGAYNMEKIKQIAHWRFKYPAFAWCASMGEGWYLPAIQELKKFTVNAQVRQCVNNTLKNYFGEEIIADSGSLKTAFHLYWSSTEASAEDNGLYATALELCCVKGSTYAMNKGNRYYIRAVAKF